MYEKNKQTIYFLGSQQSFYPSLSYPYLLPSFSNAIAMRSLVLRKISIITMMASITESEITAKQVSLIICQCAYNKYVSL